MSLRGKIGSGRAQLGAVFVLVAAAAGVETLLAGGEPASSRESSSVSVAPVAPLSDLVEVTYFLDGTVEWADVTVKTPTGTDQLSPDVPLRTKSGETGLTMTFRRGEFVYISAQMKDAYGTISCRIVSGGRLVAQSSASTAYGIATCDGTA